MKEQFKFRTVHVNGNLYLRAEDVSDYLLEIGATEPADTRNRMDEASNSIKELCQQNIVSAS